VGFLQPEEEDLWASQPGDLECRYATRCDISVGLILAEIRLWTKQRLDISGGEAGQGWMLWLVRVGNNERLARLEEDPARGGRTEDRVDKDLGRSEPGESVEGGTSKEVY
jgi:hypothetical protein